MPTDRTDASGAGLDDSDTLSYASASAAPMVARQVRITDGLGLVGGLVGAVALGALTLWSLSNQRMALAATPPVADEGVRGIAQAPVAQPEPKIAAIFEPRKSVAATEIGQASRAQPMVIDNSGAPNASLGGASGGSASTSQSSDANETFALRASEDRAVTSRAVPAGDLSKTIIQGSIIPAVLETALNSDLPGYTRAMVSRDVRSFDGADVLIPSGSRLVGQYRAAANAGQSRAFIMWTRLIRPDGVSIQLGSPALDVDGATGVAGAVDRHFFQRFGAAMLLTIVGALPSLAGEGSNNTVVIQSGAAAQGAANEALQGDMRIAPTIKVPLGTPIQVFLARDLSF